MTLHTLDELHRQVGKFPFTVTCDNGSLTVTVHAKIRDHYVGEQSDSGDISSDYFGDARIWKLYVAPPKLAEYRRAVLQYHDLTCEPHYRITEEVYTSLEAARHDAPHNCRVIAMDATAYNLPEVKR